MDNVKVTRGDEHIWAYNRDTRAVTLIHDLNNKKENIMSRWWEKRLGDEK